MTNPVHCTGIGDAKGKAVDAAALVLIFTSCGYCDRNSDSHYKLVGRKHRGFDLDVEEKKKQKGRIQNEAVSNNTSGQIL